MSTDFQPKGLLNEKDALAIPPVDFGPIMDFTQVMREVDFPRVYDTVLSVLPAEGPEISIPMNDLRNLAPETKANYSKLQPPSRVLELRTAPMAFCLILDVKQYADSVLSTYPALFQGIKDLHSNPSDTHAKSQIETSLKTNQDLIDRNKSVARFTVSRLGDFQEAWKFSGPQLLKARASIENDFKTIRDTRVAAWWYWELIKSLLVHWQEIASFFNVQIPDHMFDPNILPSIESMMGTWDAIAGDLQGVKNKLDANKLEEMRDIILNINEKQVMNRWETLRNQCGAYIDSNMQKVQSRIAVNLGDENARRSLEDNILRDGNYFAPLSR